MNLTSRPGGDEDIVGVDISDGIVTAARVKAGRDGVIRLCNAGWAEIPAGVSDREQAAVVRRVWRASGMPTCTVCASFRGRSCMLRYFRYPAMTHDELESALWLEAEESLQLKQDDIVMDWQLSQSSRPAGLGAGSRPYDGLLVAAPRADVDKLMAVLRLAGLYPIAVDVGATALCNAYAALRRGAVEEGATCLVHLTRQCADVALVFGSQGVYARSVQARGADWDASQEALLDGVMDALKYYEFKLRRQPVKQVVLVGRLPPGVGFQAALGKLADVPVSIWNPLSGLAPGSARVRRLLAKAEELPPMAISIGLALRRFDDA
jgi:Tfp pilus assembly PilM family ATPase